MEDFSGDFDFDGAMLAGVRRPAGQTGPKIPAFVRYADLRLCVRVRSGAVSRASLSTAIAQFIQAVTAESGELNGDFMTFPTPLPKKRGAPLGNRNRLTHGRRTRESKYLRAAVAAEVLASRALVAAVMGRDLPPSAPKSGKIALKSRRDAGRRR